MVSRGAKPGDKALYTSSTVALNPDDGKLVWYFQHIPGETLDMDEVFERILIDSGGRKSVFEMGKLGILWQLDRTSGKFIRATDLGYQNIVNVDPENGKVTYLNDILEQQVGQWLKVCPSTEGGRNWQAMSYHPATNQLIIPLSQSCMEMSGGRSILGNSGGGAADRHGWDAGGHGNVGKAFRLRCRDHERDVVD
jgi:alcohol dehydrogenase (cytochrome c)